MAKSLDGKGRTLFEILTGANKRDMTAQELQVYNPLKAKIGTSVSVSYESDLAGYNFFVEAIWVWETKVGNKKFYHTDYKLKAIKLGESKPVRLTLRLLPAEDSSDTLGHKIQVLSPYMDFGWQFAEENDLLSVLADEEGVFKVLQDRDGNPIEEDEQPTYWRVDDVRDPYVCRVTVLKDMDGDGAVQKDELEHKDFLVWDYSRNTTDLTTNQEFLEVLNVEEEVQYDGDDPQCLNFSISIGREIEPFQVSVI